MSKPTILTVDDDPLVSAAITRDLAGQYGSAYRIVRAASGPKALAVLTTLALRDEPVALIAADQRMPQMTGIEMLEQARVHAPRAKLLLLTAYADTDVAIKAINDIGLDYYLLKPWNPPEERLYPIIDDLLGDWRQANPDHSSDVRVVGHRWSERSNDIKMFLSRNHVPYRWYDIERDGEAERLRDLAHAPPTDLPLVLVPGGDTLRSPSTLDLAGALGLHTRAQQPLYDVCIVGGGPAGLAAAVYGASEGLSTVIVEREAPGGQAGQSAAIENYLGFPKGLSGADLAHRAIAQVSRFGAEMVLAREVVGFETRGPVRTVLFAGSGEIEARALIVATGVSYRRLDAAGLDELTGRGVYYGATPVKRANAKARTSMSSVLPTQPDRPRSTCPASPSAWCWSCGLRRSWRRCLSTSWRESPPRPMSWCGIAPRSWRAGATATSRRSPSRTGTPAPPKTFRRAGCSSSSAPPRVPSGSAPTSSGTTRASSSLVKSFWATLSLGCGHSRGRPLLSRRACPACSPPAMFDLTP